jgi:hypothetical protein
MREGREARSSRDGGRVELLGMLMAAMSAKVMLGVGK